MSGVACIAEIWGFSRNVGTILSAILIVAVVYLCDYRQVENIGMIFGLCELVWVATMFVIPPDPEEVLRESMRFPNNPEYALIVSANIGAVVMPWMIYFQQSAIVARRLRARKEYENERFQTFIGSGLTQLIMIGAMCTLAAATPGRGKDLNRVKDIRHALDPFLGAFCCKVLLSLAFVGSSLCAAFVVSLAAAWSITEAGGWEAATALDLRPSEAPCFYACFLLVVAIGVAVLASGVNIIALDVVVELVDGLLMPVAVTFLFLLATSDLLPEECRVSGIHKIVCAILFTLCSLLSLLTGISGVIGKLS